MKTWYGDRDIGGGKAKYHMKMNYLCLNFTHEETEAKTTKQPLFLLLRTYLSRNKNVSQYEIIFIEHLSTFF